MILAINASRARSGGAIAHLNGIINQMNPHDHGVTEVHVWSYSELLETLPKFPWLFMHSHASLDRSIISQLWWEFFFLPKELDKIKCSILLNIDAGSVCRYKPMVTMSRDMLSYEPGEIDRFGFSKEWLRLIALRYVQNMSLRKSEGAIFLTQYASAVIQNSCGILNNIAYIPHGVGDNFKASSVQASRPALSEGPIRCLYVSPVWLFKHQWVVVRAIEILRDRGYEIVLYLVGGGSENAIRLLDEQILKSDPEGVFVKRVGHVDQDDLPGYMADADLFVFASSCENMPNTLLEAMAVGIPIACSERGPMPEVLKDGGVFFNPEDARSISSSIEMLLTDDYLRYTLTQRAKELSEQYSWGRCAKSTLEFVVETYGRFIGDRL